jgi:hypothetical protein
MVEWLNVFRYYLHLVVVVVVVMLDGCLMLATITNTHSTVSDVNQAIFNQILVLVLVPLLIPVVCTVVITAKSNFPRKILSVQV